MSPQASKTRKSGATTGAPRTAGSSPGAGTATGRKGATSRASVEPEVLRQLNDGAIETRTLSEGLAVDFDRLARAIGLVAPPLREKGIVKRMREMSTHLSNWADYAEHPSDTVRGWAAYRLAADVALPFPTKLAHMRAFAADPHFGVREWAWLSIRDEVAAELHASMGALASWTADGDPNVRRFATEVTRPRGVWCSHIEVLKQTPAVGLPILEPLRSDASRYVRDSVANWLNDAAKTRPEWVVALAKRWRRESDTPETAALLKRALRSMGPASERPSGIRPRPDAARARRHR